MRVAHREERALDPDGEEERRPGAQVLHVHVPAPDRRRHDGVLPRLGQGDADRAGERLERQLDALGERDPAGVLLDLRDAKPRIGELVGEEAEAGDDRGPAPVARAQLQDLDGQRVAGLGALHEHRARDRVHVREVERRDRVGPRVGGDLLVGRVADVQLDVVAGVDLDRRGDRVVPDVVERVRAHVVKRLACHRSPS
jgi:hypothetical protein